MTKQTRKSAKREEEQRKHSNVVMHAKIFAVAVKYQVPALRKMSASRFAEDAEISWDHSHFAEVGHVVYTATPEDVRELRDIVLATINDHPDLLDKASVEEVMKDVGALSFKLLRVARGMPFSVKENEVEG